MKNFIMIMGFTLFVFSCSTQFDIEDDGDAGADARDDGADSAAEPDDGADAADGDDAAGDGDGPHDATGDDGFEEPDGIVTCTSGPCCGPEGIVRERGHACDESKDFRCNGDGCGADAQERSVVQRCSGSSPACDGEVEEGEWVTAAGGECGNGDVCVEGDGFAECRRCENGCEGGRCIDPECTSGPCCDGEAGVYLPHSQACDPEPVGGEFACDGTCGGTLSKRGLFRHCSGDGAECPDGLLEWHDWDVVDPCDPQEACETYGDDAWDGSCRACDYGCNTAAGTCNPECAPADPCCTGAGTIVTDTDFRCSAEPVSSTYACSGSGCGADAVVTAYYRYCNGSSPQCRDDNLKPVEDVAACHGDALCVTDGTSYAACSDCSPLFCYNDAEGTGTCYNDPYEPNDTAGSPHAIEVGTAYGGSMLHGDRDRVDFFAFELDEAGGTTESWEVTASVDVNGIVGSGGTSLDVYFTSPSGEKIYGQTFNSISTGNRYEIWYLLSGQDDDPDQYRLLVTTPTAGNLITYSFSVSAGPKASGDYPCEVYTSHFRDEHEVNDTYATASTLSLDTVYTMATLFNTCDYYDYYRFTVTGSNPVKVRAQLYSGVASIDDAYVRLEWARASDGRAYDAWSSMGVSTGQQRSFSYTFNPGTYMAVVGKDWTDPYMLNYSYELVSETPCSDDAKDLATPDDDFDDTAVPITATPYSENGVFCFLDGDWRSVTTAAGKTIAVDLSIPGYSSTSRIRILKPDSSSCAWVQDSTNPKNATCVAGVAGTYKIQTLAWSDDLPYTLTVDVM